MFVKSHQGSIRVNAARKRFIREDRALVAVQVQRQNFLDSLTVVQPKTEGEESEPISADDVVSGRVKARLRQGGKFVGLSKVQEVVASYQETEDKHRDVLSDCEWRLRDLLGNSECNKVLTKIRMEHRLNL